ncbi:hypothetical protein HY251_07790 [bacterium]|nr:hypothetical protein [bacterium]
MAIRGEETSTGEILRDARFHAAALEQNPKTKGLAGSVKEGRGALKKARDVSEDKEDARTDALAVLLRTDFELDEKVRTVELEALGAVSRNRDDPRYKEVFTKGLTALVAMRGEDEAREVRALSKKLGKHFPKLAELHAAALEKLADETEHAEKKWKDAELAAAMAFGEEVLARTALVRQLQKNEGALLVEFPGQKRRVRSFFRPTRRRGAAADDGKPEGGATGG